MSKAEGWNLPLMECITCGTPAITTDWTGMSEYLQYYPSELKVRKDRDELANDNYWFKGNRGTWQIPDINYLKSILSQVKNSLEKYLRLSDKCVNSVKQFTWKNSALKLNNFINQIEGSRNEKGEIKHDN